MLTKDIVVNGQLSEVSWGASGSVRPDYYSPTQNHCVDVKNYTITTSAGRNSLAHNVANQYNQRVNIFLAGTTYEVMVDVDGQSWTQAMKNDIVSQISNLINNNVVVNFMH